MDGYGWMGYDYVLEFGVGRFVFRYGRRVMKIEIGESLGYSYLRHVKGCWLVQTNWKASAKWGKGRKDAELEMDFKYVRERFDSDGSVFGGTKGVGQLLQQAEIDVVGVDLDGEIYALEVAFHEGGLNYGGEVETKNRVLKKLLRTYMVLKAYHASDTGFHICFASPKVNASVQATLDVLLTVLQFEFPEVDWEIITNEDFSNRIVRDTLESAETTSDFTELLVRSVKLLELDRSVPLKQSARAAEDNARKSDSPRQVQPLIRKLMSTLLDEYPDLLSEFDLYNLMDAEYCENELGIAIGHPLLRRQEEGRHISGHSRYYSHVYGGRFYVCSQWWKSVHVENAKAMLRFVEGLISRKQGHPGLAALERHRDALEGYVREAGGG